MSTEIKKVWTPTRQNTRDFYSIGLPAVTTVLKETESQEKRESLAKWRAKVGEAEAERIRQEAFSNGSYFHQQIENFARTGKCGEVSVANYIESNFQLIDVEKPLHSFKWGYKGIRDAKAIHKKTGLVYAIDWKTARKPKDESYLEDEFQQLAALNGLDPCQGGLIVRFIPGLDVPQEFFRSVDDMRKDWVLFNQRLKMYREMKKESA